MRRGSGTVAIKPRVEAITMSSNTSDIVWPPSRITGMNSAYAHRNAKLSQVEVFGQYEYEYRYGKCPNSRLIRCIVYLKYNILPHSIYNSSNIESYAPMSSYGVVLFINLNGVVISTMTLKNGNIVILTKLSSPPNLHCSQWWKFHHTDYPFQWMSCHRYTSYDAIWTQSIQYRP